MPVPQLQTAVDPAPLLNQNDYRQSMIRELLIWLIGVPVPIIAVIGLFVL